LTVRFNRDPSVSRENEAICMLVSDVMSCSIQPIKITVGERIFLKLLGVSQNIRDVLKIIMKVANIEDQKEKYSSSLEKSTIGFQSIK